MNDSENSWSILVALQIISRLQVARVVDELKDRSNWYMEGSLTSAKQLAQKLGSRDLIEAFSALK